MSKDAALADLIAVVVRLATCVEKIADDQVDQAGIAQQIAIDAGIKTWQKNFGSELELLEKVNHRLTGTIDSDRMNQND